MGDLLHHHIRRDKHDSTNVDDIKEQRQTMKNDFYERLFAFIKMYRRLILITKGTHRFMGEGLFHLLIPSLPPTGRRGDSLGLPGR